MMTTPRTFRMNIRSMTMMSSTTTIGRKSRRQANAAMKSLEGLVLIVRGIVVRGWIPTGSQPFIAVHARAGGKGDASTTAPPSMTVES